MPKTKAFQISKTEKFFPTHTSIPNITNDDNLVMAAKYLIEALQKRGTSNQHNFTPLKKCSPTTRRHFNEATGAQIIINKTNVTIAPDTAAPPRVDKINTSVLRVGQNNQPSGSYDDITPDNIRNITYIHQRKTRKNTTMDTIHEIDSAPDRLVDTTINDTLESMPTPRRSPRVINTLNSPLQM